MKLNKNHRFIQEGEKLELFNLDPEKHGWERFGEIMPIPCWAAISKDRG